MADHRQSTTMQQHGPPSRDDLSLLPRNLARPLSTLRKRANTAVCALTSAAGEAAFGNALNQLTSIETTVQNFSTCAVAPPDIPFAGAGFRDLAARGSGPRLSNVGAGHEGRYTSSRSSSNTSSYNDRTSNYTSNTRSYNYISKHADGVRGGRGGDEGRCLNNVPTGPRRQWYYAPSQLHQQPIMETRSVAPPMSFVVRKRAAQLLCSIHVCRLERLLCRLPTPCDDVGDWRRKEIGGAARRRFAEVMRDEMRLDRAYRRLMRWRE